MEILIILAVLPPAAVLFFLVRERLITSKGNTKVVVDGKRITVTFTHWAGTIEGEAFINQYGSFPTEVFIGGKPASIPFWYAMKCAYEYQKGER